MIIVHYALYMTQIYYTFHFPLEMMDSSTFKRFSASVENILDSLEDMDFTAFGKYIIFFECISFNFF